MQVDSNGVPMRDDLERHAKITRVLNDGDFVLLVSGRMIKKKRKPSESWQRYLDRRGGGSNGGAQDTQ